MQQHFPLSLPLMKAQPGSPVSSQSPKPRQHRNREVSSRFLPSTPTSTTTSTEYVSSLSPGESHSNSHSPLRRKTGSSSSDSRSRNKNTEDHSFTRPQLWPSSSSSSSSSSTVKRNSGTLADHITEDRIREHLEFDNKIHEKEKVPTKTSSNLSQNNNKNSKENDRSIIGGSMRKPTSIVPGRLSVDENALYRKSSFSRRNSYSLTNSLDSESDFSDACSLHAAASGTSTLSSRKMGIEVPSKYMSDVKPRRGRRGTSDSNILDLNGDSSVLNKFALKTAIKRANSLTGFKNSKSQWALSPGRSGSPAMSVECMDKPMSFSTLKPPSSPTKAKGVERFLTMGFDLFKSKKSLFNSPSSMGSGNSEAVHQLRMLDNRLMQWRYANARTQAVNQNISQQAESNLIYAWDGLTKLRLSVLQKKIQFERQKLEMKLNFILYSQMKLLNAWRGMERQHLSAITTTKESLHSVVCRVPLLEGGKVDIPSASIALRRASDLTASIKSMFTSFSPLEVDKTAAMLSELAKVVAQEKRLLQEFYDLIQTISVYELRERSVKCNLIQLEGCERKYKPQQVLPEITS